MVEEEMISLLKQYKYEFIKTSLGTMRVFVSRGRKPSSIILVHGLIVCSSFTRPTAKELAKKHKVFVPDLLGRGKSDMPDKFLTIELMIMLLAQGRRSSFMFQAPRLRQDNPTVN